MLKSSTFRPAWTSATEPVVVWFPVGKNKKTGKLIYRGEISELANSGLYSFRHLHKNGKIVKNFFGD